VPHYPKPWFREQNRTWYVQLGGRQINLGQDEEAARQKYHRLMAEHRPGEAPAAPEQSPLADDLFGRFLLWAQVNRAQATAETYRERIQSFLDSLVNQQLEVRHLKPYHVQQWIDSHPGWSDTTKAGKMTAVQAALNWAVRQGFIDRSPLVGLQKPSKGRRESYVSVEDWPKLLAKVKTPTLRDAIVFTWETGVRPQELRKIEKRHCRLEEMRIVFVERESKGKRRQRVIHLTPMAAELAARLCKRHPKGPIFRNRDGKPWKPYAMNNAMGRLAAHFGNRPLCFNDFRHGFGTRLLQAGVDPITVAALMGHKDPSTLAKVYSHVHADAQHLRDALSRAASGPPASQIPAIADGATAPARAPKKPARE